MVHDSAKLTGATSGAGGTATYSVYTDSSCSLNKQDAGTNLTVTGGVVPDSNTLQFNSAGRSEERRVGKEDTNNTGTTSQSTREKVAISKKQPSISMTV